MCDEFYKTGNDGDDYSDVPYEYLAEMYRAREERSQKEVDDYNSERLRTW